MYDVEVCINGWATHLPANTWYNIGDEIVILVGDDKWIGEVLSCNFNLTP